MKRINRGEKFNKFNISMMRGTEKYIGLSLEFFSQIARKKAKRVIKKNEPINIGMISED